MKAQASMEFITTYAWAISVVLVMVGAVIYFGVFDSSTFLKPYCSITKEMVCDDYSVHENGIRLKLRNNYEKDITIYEIDISSDYGSTASCDQGQKNISIGKTDNFECRFSGNILQKGEKEKIYATVIFSRKDGVNQYNASGSLLGAAQTAMP